MPKKQLLLIIVSLSLLLGGCVLPIQAPNDAQNCMFNMINNVHGAYRCKLPNATLTIWNTGAEFEPNYNFAVVSGSNEEQVAESAVFVEKLCRAEPAVWHTALIGNRYLVSDRWLPKDCNLWITAQIYKINLQREKIEQARTWVESLSTR